MNPIRRRDALLLALAGATVLPRLAIAADTQAALAPVVALDNALLRIMQAGKATPFPQRYQMLAPVIGRSFDLAHILEFSVGPAWSGFSTQQQGLLLDEFERYTVANYAANFNSYDGQRFDVSPTTRAVGADQVVRTTLVPRSGSPTRIDYVVRNEGGAWRIVDVLLDGTISRVAVQRSDFRKVVRTGGAPGLVDHAAAEGIGTVRRDHDLTVAGSSMNPLAIVLAAAAGLGLVQHIAGLIAVRRFRAHGEPAGARPPITVLKPLHGDEPLLETALASFCVQDYPAYQIVFGVHDAADPALATVRRLMSRFPDRDLTVVVDATPHGSNGKIGNLINMLPSARHDALMIADSDVHVAPDLLTSVAAAMARPGTGLVTTLYTGLPARPALASRLGATQITHAFLPGVLLGRALGRQDCLGATMTLRRETLASIGGLPALANHLADDAVLGMLVRGRGLAVGLAGTVAATTVVETRLSELWRHELRWARTMRSVSPAGYALSALQYPLLWAALASVAAGFAAWSLALFAGAWVLRGGITRAIDRALRLAARAPVWLLPVRDLISVLLILASFAGDRVEWRGQVMRVDRPGGDRPPGRRRWPGWIAGMVGTGRKRGDIAPT